MVFKLHKEKPQPTCGEHQVLAPGHGPQRTRPVPAACYEKQVLAVAHAHGISSGIHTQNDPASPRYGWVWGKGAPWMTHKCLRIGVPLPHPSRPGL
jgi:hypothetical protein